MTIKTKITSGLLGVLCLFVACSVITYARGKKTNERLTLMNEAFLPLFRQVVHLQSSLSGLGEDLRRFYFQRSKNSTSENSSLSESSSFSRMIRDIYPYILQKRFLTIERILEKKDANGGSAFPTELKTLVVGIRTEVDALLQTQEVERFEIQLQKVKGQLAELSRRAEEESKVLTRSVQEENREALYLGLVLSFVMSVAGAFTILLSFRVLNPLPLLISSVKKIADGDFHQSLKVKPSDEGEVATLAREYNRMLEALRERDSKIRTQQQEILRSERLAAIGQLSAEVVHEIRNPLNSINLNIDWLKNEIQSSDKEITKTFTSLSREIERLGQITESYLARAKVSVEGMQKAPVNEILGEVLELEERLEETVNIKKRLWPEELYVKANKAKLKQAFINIIKNARESMPMGGDLVVETERKRNIFEVSIRDSGCGMSETTKKKAADPFFSTKANGTGIGLSVTKSIIEEAHGSLLFESVLGQGTVVKMQFPV